MSSTKKHKIKFNNIEPEKANVKTKSKWYFNIYFLVFAIIIVTILTYSTSLKNDFINFDDSDFIAKNEFIKDLSLTGIKNIFLALDKHDPLTALSHAVTYKFWNLNPFPYHAINLLFHLINIFLVFLLIFKLTKNKISSSITALLFAIHPLRVESVCWISERKDVLYSMFFLLAIIVYISYIAKGYKIKYLILSLILFICSLLSKFAAVTLPFVLLIIDYYYNRKINSKIIIEKIPFFLLSILLAVYHFATTTTIFNNIVDFSSFSISDKLLMGSYSLFYYLYQLIFFLNYAALHPYPDKINGFLPVEYYISFGIIIILAIVIFFIIRHFSKYRKELIFGLLFFIINISLVLHIVPISGIVIVGDRYSYMAYIGIFFIVGYVFPIVTSKNKLISNSFVIIFFCFILLCIYSTYNRTKVWKNGLTFWLSVTDKYPNYFMGYYGTGIAKYYKWDYSGSKTEFDKSIKFNPNYGLSYLYRARIESKYKKYKNALLDYNTAIDLLSENANTYYERGNIFFSLRNFHEAIIDYNLAIKLKPDISTFYNNRGYTFLQMNQLKEALNDFNKAIELSPLSSEALNNRANLKLLLKDYKGAISDFNYTIDLKPEIVGLYIGRARAKSFMGDNQGVINDCLKGLSIDRNNKILYLIMGIAELQIGNFSDACKQLKSASTLGSLEADSLIKKYCN